MSKYNAPPVSPTEVRITYKVLDRQSRLGARTVVQSLPDECTVQALADFCYELTRASPRQPLELHYLGKLLDPSKLLRDYAIKAHSEIMVVTWPKVRTRSLRPFLPFSATNASWPLSDS